MLEKRIMRRVYYSYVLSLFSGAMFWQGVLLGVCVGLFGRLTHVAALYHNLLAVPLGEVPIYVLETFERAVFEGELLTVLVVVFMVGLSLSFFRRAMVTYQFVGGHYKLG